MVAARRRRIKQVKLGRASGVKASAVKLKITAKKNILLCKNTKIKGCLMNL